MLWCPSRECRPQSLTQGVNRHRGGSQRSQEIKDTKIQNYGRAHLLFFLPQSGEFQIGLWYDGLPWIHSKVWSKGSLKGHNPLFLLLFYYYLNKAVCKGLNSNPSTAGTQAAGRFVV